MIMNEKFDFPFRVLSAISSPLRVEILKLLSRKKLLSFTEIMYELGMTPKTDAGKFAYHLNQLRDANLVISDEKTGKYFLTPLGESVVDFLWLLDDFGRREFGEIFVRTSRLKMERFDRSKIAEALRREAGVPQELAEEIAKEAEDRLFKLKVKYLTAPLIREFVNAILLEKGLEEYRHSLTRLGLPVYDVSQLVKNAGKKSSFPNPELARGLAGDSVFEQYLLLKVLPRKVADAHLSGKIHISQANSWILKPYGIQHDLSLILKMNTTPNFQDILFNPLMPPRDVNDVPLFFYNFFNVFNTHFSSFQTIDFFNIFLAPLLKSVNYEKMKSILRKIIEFLNRKWSQKVITFNLEFTTPPLLENEPAITFNGKEDGTYGEYEEETKNILRALIEIFRKGRDDGLPYTQPQLVFKIRKGSMDVEDFDNVLNLSIERGQPLYANLTLDWQLPNTNYSASLHRFDSNYKRNWKIDTIRTCCMAWIAINMVRIALLAKGDDDKFFEEFNDIINCAVKAFLVKRDEIRKRSLIDSLLPLLNLKIDDEPYFREETAAYMIGYVGLPEAVQIHTSNFISEKAALNFLMRILKKSEKIAEEISTEHDLRLNFMESPDVEPSLRFLKLNRGIFRDYKNFFPSFYSTNVIPATSNLSTFEKIRLANSTHTYLRGGHILNINLDNNPIEFNELKDITNNILANNIGLFAYTRSSTYCLNCKEISQGILRACPTCNHGFEKLVYNTRLTGPYMSIYAINMDQDFLNHLIGSRLTK